MISSERKSMKVDETVKGLISVMPDLIRHPVFSIGSGLRLSPD
jgi:hypothetical protein